MLVKTLASTDLALAVPAAYAVPVLVGDCPSGQEMEYAPPNYPTAPRNITGMIIGSIELNTEMFDEFYKE